MGYVSLLLLGIIIIALGIINFKGNIETIHRYNRRKVSAADAPKYGKTMGLGTMIIGASILVTAVLQLFFEREALFSIMAAGAVIGAAVMLYAQFKYNQGIF